MIAFSKRRAGAYYMSSRDSANYMAHFSSTDLIGSRQTRDLTATGATQPDDQMVRAFSQPDNWMKQNFNMPNVFRSNGVEDGARARFSFVCRIIII